MGASAETPSAIHDFKSWKKKSVIFDNTGKESCRKQLTLGTH